MMMMMTTTTPLLQAGSSVTITSFCNAAVFYCATIIPIHAIKTLLIAAGTIIVFNYITAMTLIPAILGLWAGLYQTEEGRKTTRDDVVKQMTKSKSGLAGIVPEVGVIVIYSHGL